MKKAYALNVFRHRGRRYVTPSIRSPIGFSALDVVVEEGPGGLAAALAEAERLMREELKKPAGQRRMGDSALLRAAGSPDAETFGKHAVACFVLRTPTDDEIDLLVPRDGGPELGSTGTPRSFPAGTDHETLAKAIEEMLASAPEPAPAPPPRRRARR